MVPVPLGVGPALMVPHVGAQAVPPCDSAHVTPLLAPSFMTVPVNAVNPDTATCALDGVTVMVMAGTMIVVELDFVVSAAEVAVIVTVRLAAGVGGV